MLGTVYVCCSPTSWLIPPGETKVVRLVRVYVHSQSQAVDITTGFWRWSSVQDQVAVMPGAPPSPPQVSRGWLPLMVSLAILSRQRHGEKRIMIPALHMNLRAVLILWPGLGAQFQRLSAAHRHVNIQANNLILKFQ